MKIDDLIAELGTIRKRVGNLDVWVFNEDMNTNSSLFDVKVGDARLLSGNIFRSPPDKVLFIGKELEYGNGTARYAYEDGQVTKMTVIGSEPYNGCEPDTIPYSDE